MAARRRPRLSWPTSSADELLLPDGAIVRRGMTFSGTTSGGGTFSGTISNRIGDGYTNLDGFGFINAEAAVQAPLH